MREVGMRRRLVIRRNGFSSTFSRRDLCRASVKIGPSAVSRSLTYSMSICFAHLLRLDRAARMGT